MKYKLTIFCFIAATTLQKQKLFAQNVTEFAVHFNYGKHDLTPAGKAKIDSILKSIPDKKLKYNVAVTGHTDNTGTEIINRNLSYKRAETISSYIGRTLHTKGIQVSGRSYSNPVSRDTSAAAKAINRRVEVAINLPVPKINNIGKIKLNATEYTLDADKGDTLIYSSGTKIFIYKGIFVDENGKKISGKVTISYVEYRDPIDFILAGVPMFYSEKNENTIFNSSGMFNMTASQDNKPVYIKQGEKIDVAFSPTQALPEQTNFYNYDSTRSHWSTLSNLSATNSEALFGHKETTKNICSNDECEGMKMMIDLGSELTQNKVPVYSNIVRKYHLNIPEIRRMDKNIKHVESEIKIIEKAVKETRSEVNKKPKFKITDVNTVGNTIRFKILGDTTRKNNIADLGKVSWEFSSNFENRRKLNALSGKEFSFCRLYKTGKRGKTLIVFDKNGSKSKAKLEAVMILDDNNTKAMRDSVYRTYRLKTRTVKKTEDRLKDKLSREVAVLNTKTHFKNALEDTLDDLMGHVKADSITCFWRNSKKFMSAEEKDMLMIFWYEHFQENNPKFKTMFAGLKKTNALGDTCNAIVKRAEDVKLRAEREAKLLTSAKDMMVSLSVSSFGIFNCDQIERLKSPETIAANYADADGKNVNMITAYLIDNRINSVLIYNGYMGLSPSKFAYSPSSKNTLMCFDDRGNPWICSSGQFKKAVEGVEETKTFVIKKVNDVKNKEELMREF